jgi:hypothetical protein
MNIYRYITLDRFFSSLKQVKTEWKFTTRFNNPLEFEDEWEGLGNGLVNQLKSIEIEKSYVNRVELDGGIIDSKNPLRLYINRLNGIDENLDLKLLEAIKYSNEHLVSCWFCGEENGPHSESFAMWNLYAKTNGILIGFEKEEIEKALKNLEISFLGKKVDYVTFLQSKFNPEIHCKLDSLFLKDNSYKHEQEYRFIIKEKSKTNFKDINLPLPKYLTASPSLSEGTISHLNKIIKNYNNLTLKQSKLSTKHSRKDIVEYLK